MNLFSRAFDSNDRIQSAALHLSAAAARLALSIVLSIPQLPDATWAEVKKLLTVETLWSFCIVLAGWAIATIVGGVVGLVVNGLLVAYGVVELWEQLKVVTGSLRRWVVQAYEATNRAELAAAGKHFADAVSTSGVTVVELVITHRVFRAVEGKLRQSMPPPTWLRAQYEDALRQRERNGRSSEAERQPRSEIAKRVGEAAQVARGAGAKRAAEFPMEVVAATGALLAMAGVCGAAWMLASSGKRERP